MAAILYIIIPCFNDGDVLPVTAPLLLGKLKQLITDGTVNVNSRLVFVDDGSLDDTWTVIRELHDADSRCSGIRLTENTGEQNAILAGLNAAKDHCDCMITIDSDLQDDIDLIDLMVGQYAKGSEIVLGVRSSRRYDSCRERFFSRSFYICMRLFHTGLENEHSNFRLMSSAAAEKLLKRAGDAFFLPAEVCNLGIGYQTAAYVRLPRSAGASSYSFKKKLILAMKAVVIHSKNLSGILLTVGITAGLAGGLLAAVWLACGRTMLLPLSLGAFAATVVCFTLRALRNQVIVRLNKRQKKIWNKIRKGEYAFRD